MNSPMEIIVLLKQLKHSFYYKIGPIHKFMFKYHLPSMILATSI